MFHYLRCLLISIVLASHMLTTGAHPLEAGAGGCQEPASVAEMYRSLRTTAIETAGVYRHSVTDEAPDVMEQTEFRAVSITSLNKTCHTHRSTRMCHCRSIDQINFDDNRIPKVLMQTSCCHSNQRSADWIGACVEIYHDVQVLRRTSCLFGVYQYSLQWERIPVGCKCHVMPRRFSEP